MLIFLHFYLIKESWKNVPKNIKQHNGFQQLIKMISDGSCDTEDWSNDAANSASALRNKLNYSKIENLF